MPQFQVAFASHTESGNETVDAEYYRREAEWVTFKTADHKIVADFPANAILSIRCNGWVDEQDRRHTRFDAAPMDSDAGPEYFTQFIDPEVSFGDIAYGRYDQNRVPTGHRFAGWIEDRARSWILFLGEHGAPALYWPRRDEAGGVIGRPIELGK